MTGDKDLASVPGAAYREVPAFFAADGEHLFGVLTSPTGDPTGLCVTMLAGAWYGPATHRNRLFVRLARRLATEWGCHSLRVDFHGAGESTGVSHLGLDDPFPGDLTGAVHWLQSQGIHRHVVVGACLGSRTALMAAPEIDGLEGLVLLAPPLGTEADHEAETYQVVPAVVDAFRYLMGAGIPTLVVYGRKEPGPRQAFEGGVLGPLDLDGATAAGHLELGSVPGRVHGSRRIEVQDAVLEAVAAWVSARHSVARS